MIPFVLLVCNVGNFVANCMFGRNLQEFFILCANRFDWANMFVQDHSDLVNRPIRVVIFVEYGDGCALAKKTKYSKKNNQPNFY